MRAIRSEKAPVCDKRLGAKGPALSSGVVAGMLPFKNLPMASPPVPGLSLIQKFVDSENVKTSPEATMVPSDKVTW